MINPLGSNIINNCVTDFQTQISDTYDMMMSLARSRTDSESFEPDNTIDINIVPAPNSVGSLGSAPSSISSFLSNSSSSQNNSCDFIGGSPLMYQTNNLPSMIQASERKDAANAVLASPPLSGKSGRAALHTPVAVPHYMQQPSTSQSQSSTDKSVSKIDLKYSTTENSRFSVPAIPRCSVCSADSTGIHFGVEACAACSAFFRRTVVLNKNYPCAKNGDCQFNHSLSTGQKCRSCRFKKCLEVGMDKSAVQHRRDAIGKYSAAVKREYSPVSFNPDTQLADALCLPSEKPSLSDTTVLDELIRCYEALNKRRKVFYANVSICDLFDDGELEMRELENFGDCMYELYRVEPRLCIEFITKNRYLSPLETSEKTKILSHFILHFQAVEEPYLTWKLGGTNTNRYWVMQNRVYLDMTRIDHYFDSNKCIMKGLNLDKASAVKLFKPSFMHAMEQVGISMANMDLTRRELICLVGFILFDPTIEGVTSETQKHLQYVRNELMKNMMKNYYVENDACPEVRMAQVILLISGVKVHAQKTRENMQMLQFFDIIPRDKFFGQLCGLDNPVNNPPPSKKSTTAQNEPGSSQNSVA